MFLYSKSLDEVVIHALLPPVLRLLSFRSVLLLPWPFITRN
uniref:Uncharacterized protein n=1 Tax=Rhizophora mucronata TaxID=61149 RepID=A0A2P2MXK4_RHIMU